VTVTEFEVEVFGVIPTQLIENTVLVVKFETSTPTLFDTAPPVLKFVPVQLCASTAFHLIDVEPPYGMSVSVALIETAGLETLTVTLEFAVAPPAFLVHVKLYVLDVESAPVETPVVLFATLDVVKSGLVHTSAFVDDHLSKVEPPTAI
jgi:hypothetical protein